MISSSSSSSSSMFIIIIIISSSSGMSICFIDVALWALLPDGVGTDRMFIEGPQIPYMP